MNAGLPGPSRVVIAPFLGDGVTPGGLYVTHHELMPPILGRVVCVHASCHLVSPGDVIAFRQNTSEEIPGTYGKFHTLETRDIAAILDDFDKEYSDVT